MRKHLTSAGTRERFISAQRPAPSAQRPAPSAQRPAPSAQRPAPSAQRPAPQRPAPSAQRPAPSAQRPAPSGLSSRLAHPASNCSDSCRRVPVRLPGRPAPAPTHATASSSPGSVGHGCGVRAVAAAALACAALMGVSAPAQAQTEVWSATLTVKELSPNSSTFGCTNTTSSVRCSDFLSDDEFTYDSTDYAITAIFLTRNAQLQLHFDTDLTTAAQTLTLDVAGTTFAFEDAHVKGGRAEVLEQIRPELVGGRRRRVEAN